MDNFKKIDLFLGAYERTKPDYNMFAYDAGDNPITVGIVTAYGSDPISDATYNFDTKRFNFWSGDQAVHSCHEDEADELLLILQNLR